jgi:hypothetical protein
LIGSTDLHVASLPSQPYSLFEVKLDNCSDPKAKLKLEIQRKETEVKQSKKDTGKPHEMGLLRTEGQVWEESVMSRRANPNIPNAYEISRRNYVKFKLIQKQAEVSCHE